MQYLRKVNCPSLNIQTIFKSQSNALGLYTKLKNLGYHDSELLDYFVEEGKEISTDDSDIEKLMERVVTK